MSTWEIGNIGERLIEDYLKASNWLTYPAPKNERHPIDWFLTTRDKKYICIADAKTKPARGAYEDTGINLSHFEDYKYLQDTYKIDAMLIFVDPVRMEIYGNQLNKLTRQIKVDGIKYPLIQPTSYNKPIIYFPLVSMGHIAKLTQEQCQEIMVLSKRKYDYSNYQKPKLNTVLQPALFDLPYNPKKKKVAQFNDPNFLKYLLLIKFCQCGINELSPYLHDDYCKYRDLLLDSKYQP